MAIAIKKCKLTQQGQDLTRLLPNLIKAPFQFYKQHSKQAVSQCGRQKCLQEIGLLCSHNVKSGS
jgi:transposase